MYANHMLQKHCERNSSNKHDDSMDTTTINLPRIVYTHKTTHSSTRYVQHLPARIDTSLATPSMYALVLAIYLEHLFDRNSFEKITLVVDVRAGRGWANIPALHLISFMQACCKLLCDLHPERLQSCILFPLPKVATVIWRAVKPFLHKDTRKKILMANGQAGEDDPVPKKMSQLIEEQMIHLMEEQRMSCFSRG